MLEPTMPLPIITTSAVSVIVVASSKQSVQSEAENTVCNANCWFPVAKSTYDLLFAFPPLVLRSPLTS